MADSVRTSVPDLTDADAALVELLKTRVEGVLASVTTPEVAVSVAVTVADGVNFVARDRANDDSAPTCSEVWVREVVKPDDTDEVEDVDAGDDDFKVEVEVGVIVELVNRDFDNTDEEEGLDVAAMDEDENLDVDVVAATDVDVILVEERDEESLVDDAGADVGKGSSADEVVSNSAPASPFARLVEVTAPMNQIRQLNS